MFVGVDHGSRAIRVAILRNEFNVFELERDAGKGRESSLLAALEAECDLREIELLDKSMIKCYSSK